MLCCFPGQPDEPDGSLRARGDVLGRYEPIRIVPAAARS
jgi:hypothetical protein